MYMQPVFFEKDSKIHEAQANTTIKNRTDNVITNVRVSEIADLGDNKYRISLFEAKSGWDKQFEVEGSDEI